MNNAKNNVYTIAFIIMIIIVGGIFFYKQKTENHYLELVSTAMNEYDNRANFDIQVTILDKLNQIAVKLTPADTYTTNMYGDFYVYYNMKSENVIRTTSLEIPLSVFQ